MNDELRDLAGQYDENYFEHHLGQPYRRGDPGWQAFFGRVADAIVAELAPETVLDAGCAIGFLVEALRDRGVDASGVDISEYAIAQMPEELRAHCRVGSITEPFDRSYDLIVCIEVLEHIPESLAEATVANLTAHSTQILFSSTPSDYSEPTHLNVQPMEYWAGLFARHGFFREVDFDAGFIAPHAAHFRASAATAVSVARSYERWHWRHREELGQLRAANVEAEAQLATLRAAATANADELVTLQERARTAEAAAEATVAGWEARSAEWEARSAEWEAESAAWQASSDEWEAFVDRSGVRMYLKLAAIRSRLAPRGSRRDSVVRAMLSRLADAFERPRARTVGADAQAAVAFVSGCPGDAMRYRCDHQAEQLGLLGASADVAVHGEIDLLAALDRYGCFVLHRVPWGPDIKSFLEGARQQGRRVIFDTDDLVFEPAAARHVAALEDMTAAERQLYVGGLVRYRRTLQESDGVIVSTDALQQLAAALQERVSVAYNAASGEMVELADESVRRRNDRNGHGDSSVTIAYMSGTPTHNRDFREAADAVLSVLDQVPAARFVAVGHISLDERFDRYGARVERIPLQPWQRLPELLARIDINLAPLEPDNPFTDAKSCLKYIEAGLVGVPTIASSRPDFVRAISPGANGLLADSPGEWRDGLMALVASPELRRELGAAAATDVRRSHTVGPRARALYATVAELVRSEPVEPLTINWVVRAPIAQRAGGYRTIFRLANGLGRRGHTVRVYVEPIAHLSGLSEREIQAFVAEHFGPLELEVIVGHADIAPADATFATNWPTAAVVAGHTRSLFKLYLIQDLESEFYAAGSPEARAAEATYSLPLRYVCYGQYLADVLGERNARPADALHFALEPAFRTVVDPAERPGPPSVLFFARPDQRRRGFDLGIEALSVVKQERPDVEIRFFGCSDIELPAVDFPYVNLGVLSLDDLAKALNSAHVFLGFSLTNISHAPFEAMACGCAVVEADVPSVRAMVPADACVLAAPEPEAVSAAVVSLLADEALRVRIARRGSELMTERSWDRTVAQLEALLEEACFVRLGAPDR